MRSTSAHSRTRSLLGLENRAPDQRIGAAFDLDTLLETNVGERNVELCDQELPEVRLDLVMAGLAGQMAQDFE